MSSPTSIPTAPAGGVGFTADELWHSAFRAMASPVRVQLDRDTAAPERRHDEIRALFAEVERQCTRFDAGSDLMRANAAGGWLRVGTHCFAAVAAAAEAHRATDGMFDPRILTTLVAMGYDRTWAERGSGGRLGPVPAARSVWLPGLDAANRCVWIGDDPIDLGGIGKGLTLRWAAEALQAVGSPAYLIDAGGDCVAYGGGPDGSGWRIAVEDPASGTTPVAVLSVVDAACATSSVRLRSWVVDGTEVHHLIDPRTGRPGGGDLRSVTVIGDDPAWAEVWSKVLFLCGPDIAAAAEERGLAALWVHADGTHELSTAMAGYVIWRRA